MAKKPGLSLERHKEVAAELKEIQKRLIALSVEMGNAYPRSGEKSWPAKELARAERHVGSARCWAEENLFRDHPGDADINIYYGGED